MTEYEAFVMYIPMIAEIITELKHSDMSLEEYQQWRAEVFPTSRNYGGFADKVLKVIDFYAWGYVTDSIKVNGTVVKLYLAPIANEGGYKA